jgi:hypothetical protein
LKTIPPVIPHPCSPKITADQSSIAQVSLPNWKVFLTERCEAASAADWKCMSSKGSCSAAEVPVPVQLGNGQSGGSLGDDEADRAAAAAKEVGESDKKFAKWIAEGMSGMKVKRINTAQHLLSGGSELVTVCGDTLGQVPK